MVIGRSRSSVLFLRRPAASTAVASRVQVEILDLPRAGEPGRLIRLREAPAAPARQGRAIEAPALARGAARAEEQAPRRDARSDVLEVSSLDDVEDALAGALDAALAAS